MMLKNLLALTLAAGTVAASGIAVAPTAHAADPLYGAPQPGECRTYSVADVTATSQSSGPVECAKATATVLAVEAVPNPADTAQVYDLLGSTCNAMMRTVVGGSAPMRAQASYQLTYFVPTADEIAAGASWARCDLVLLAGSSLKTLPAGVPYLQYRLSDRVRRCLTSALAVTTCDRRHGWRSVAAVRVPSTTFPGDKALLALVRAKCPGGTQYGTWPGQLGWASADRFVTCFRKTRG